MPENWKIISFPEFEDERGNLVPFEFNEDFPFPVKRVYLVTGKSGKTRGGHAHKIESEFFVAASGSVTAEIHDGKNPRIFSLNNKHEGLLVKPGCWHEFTDFSEDAVLLCFSSTHYLPGDGNYITDKDEFLKSL